METKESLPKEESQDLPVTENTFQSLLENIKKEAAGMTGEEINERTYETISVALTLIRAAGAPKSSYYTELMAIAKRRHPNKRLELAAIGKSTTADVPQNSALAEHNESKTYVYGQSAVENQAAAKKAVAATSDDSEEILPDAAAKDNEASSEIDITPDMSTEDVVAQFGELKKLKEWLREEGQTVPGNMKADAAVKLLKRVLFD